MASRKSISKIYSKPSCQYHAGSVNHRHSAKLLQSPSLLLSRYSQQGAEVKPIS